MVCSGDFPGAQFIFLQPSTFCSMFIMLHVKYCKSLHKAAYTTLTVEFSTEFRFVFVLHTLAFKVIEFVDRSSNLLGSNFCIKLLMCVP